MPDFPKSALQYLRGLARGLGPDLLGGPVDAAQDAVNLGIAAAGYAGHKAGLIREPFPLLSGSPGTSDWWAKQVNVPDDGSGAYTAGRMTPMGVAAAGAGVRKLAEVAPRQMEQMLQRVAPAAQPVYAIRPGGDPRLMPAHSTYALPEELKWLRSSEGTLELQSPSIAIVKDKIGGRFGDIKFIPREGAFDPATHTSTLFARDAYTARHGDFPSQVISGVQKKGYQAKIAAADRLKDRLLSGIRPEDYRLNETLALGQPGPLGNAGHEASIVGSPAFRSFESFERSPKGAKLLMGEFDTEDPGDYSRKVLAEAAGDFGWWSRDAMDDLFEDYWRHIRNRRDPATWDPATNREVLKSLMRTYVENGFKSEELLKDIESPQWGQMLENFKKLPSKFAKAPSTYAELKVIGPTQVTPENWAGVVVPKDHPDLAQYRQLFDELKLPIMPYDAADPKGSFYSAQRLQQLAGPARKTPLIPKR